jgi:hypothetical protein
MSEQKHTEHRVELLPNELDSVLWFALRYYRDGAPDVDHLDVDLQADGAGSSVTWVVRVLEGAAAKSPEEAARWFGGRL